MQDITERLLERVVATGEDTVVIVHIDVNDVLRRPKRHVLHRVFLTDIK